MIERIKALLAVVEEGSVNRAAARLRVAQPALSRQMMALEAELGEKLLERTSTGVKPTGFCHDVLRTLGPVLAAYDGALASLRRNARRGREEMRIGFLNSAGPPLLAPALSRLRAAYPQLKLTLRDLSPKEQIDALRAGQIDVALIGQEGLGAARDFYCRTLSSTAVCAAISSADPLASRRQLRLSEFKGKGFIGVDEEQVPGRNRWMRSLCRAAGFKPRILASCDGLNNVLSLVVSETAVTLLPDYFQQTTHPGITFVPISDPHARWDFIVLLQRGKIPEPARALVDALMEAAAAAPGPRPVRPAIRRGQVGRGHVTNRE